MSNTAEQQFQQILDDARPDPYVLGMCLGGSRGKGFEDEFSDYDICIIMAHDSIGYLLDVLFGYEGRHRPFYGYLERELRKYPLRNVLLSSDDLLAKIDAITASADRATQQELLAMVDTLLRPAGFGDVIDDWAEKYEWMQSFKG